MNRPDLGMKILIFPVSCSRPAEVILGVEYEIGVNEASRPMEGNGARVEELIGGGCLSRDGVPLETHFFHQHIFISGGTRWTPGRRG